jgi:hypothetical protein
VQVPLELERELLVAALLPPALQRPIGALEQLRRLLAEDRGDLGIEFLAVLGFGLLLDDRGGWRQRGLSLRLRARIGTALQETLVGS